MNPPTDTWVALGENARGYKMLAHFALGLFAEKLYVRVGALSEAPQRAAFAEALGRALDALPTDAEIVFEQHHPTGVPVRELAADPGRLREAARRRQGEVLLERSKPADVVVGEDLAAVVRVLLPPLVAVYREWSATQSPR